MRDLASSNVEVFKIRINTNGRIPSIGDGKKERPLQHTKTQTIPLQAECQHVIKLFQRAKAVIYIYILALPLEWLTVQEVLQISSKTIPNLPVLLNLQTNVTAPGLDSRTE
jgi:hypothetical protein